MDQKIGPPIAPSKYIKCFCIRILVLLMIFCLNGCVQKVNNDSINVLILTGRNNHEWEKTTAALEKMYRQHPVFEVRITENPDTLFLEDLKSFDVLVSNWNNWPENDLLWDSRQEADFLQFIEEGGGFVFFHSGASSYYHSDIYQRIGIGRWGNQTAHGEPTRAKITHFNQTHPITSGMNDFFILDEIWEKTDIHPDAETLAGLTATDKSDGHQIIEDAVFINRTGKGRSFYTILGHDERALFNTGLQTLLLRATEWAARGDVTQDIPQDLKLETGNGTGNFDWIQTDTTLKLVQNGDLVWQYNFRNRFGKTYFHPLYYRRNRLTCESPADHSWHPGLWFSWKFINDVNYWEYRDDFRTEATGFKSEGITDLKAIDIRKNPDFSADIGLLLVYYPDGENPVLQENRKIFVSCPDNRGSYYIDYFHEFKAAHEDVRLDRTPIPGEPDGKSWGGYGGLTIRFNQDLTEAVSIPDANAPEYPKAPWFYMGFETLTGDRAGAGMFQHPEYTTPFTRWYFARDRSVPFFFFTPAALYDQPITLAEGESLALKYRVWVLGETSVDSLDSKYGAFIGR